MESTKVTVSRGLQAFVKTFLYQFIERFVAISRNDFCIVDLNLYDDFGGFVGTSGAVRILRTAN